MDRILKDQQRQLLLGNSHQDYKKSAHRGTHIILALRGLKKEDHRSEASQGLHNETVSEKQTNEQSWVVARAVIPTSRGRGKKTKT